MDTVKKVLYFAVGIILTVGFISMGVTIFNRSKETIVKAQSDYEDIIGKFGEVEYAAYDTAGSTASGSEIIRIIENLEDDNITIYVQNGAYLSGVHSGKGVAYSCSDGNHCGYGNESSGMVSYENAVKKMKDRSISMYYINPTASFSASLHKDANGQVDEITFIQK